MYSLHTCASYIRRRFFHSPRSNFMPLGVKSPPSRRHASDLCLKTWFCPSICMSLSKTNPSKRKLSISGTKGQAGERRSEGHQIQVPTTLHPKPWRAAWRETPVCFLPPLYPAATKDNICPVRLK